jgi:hypothetical protein
MANLRAFLATSAIPKPPSQGAIHSAVSQTTVSRYQAEEKQQDTYRLCLKGGRGPSIDEITILETDDFASSNAGEDNSANNDTNIMHRQHIIKSTRRLVKTDEWEEHHTLVWLATAQMDDVYQLPHTTKSYTSSTCVTPEMSSAEEEMDGQEGGRWCIQHAKRRPSYQHDWKKSRWRA